MKNIKKSFSAGTWAQFKTTTEKNTYLHLRKIKNENLCLFISSVLSDDCLDRPTGEALLVFAFNKIRGREISDYTHIINSEDLTPISTPEFGEGIVAQSVPHISEDGLEIIDGYLDRKSGIYNNGIQKRKIKDDVELFQKAVDALTKYHQNTKK
jgi:hypothetical protein